MKKLIVLVIMALFFFAPYSEAGINDRFSNIELMPDNPPGSPSSGKGWFYTKTDSDGVKKLYYKTQTGVITEVAGSEKYVDISIFDLAVLNSGIPGSRLDTLYDSADGGLRSAPGLLYDSQSPAIVWPADSTSVTDAIITLKLPQDYVAGLGFNLLVSELGATYTGSFDGYRWAYISPNASPAWISYKLYVDSEGNWTNGTVYQQAEVQLKRITGKLHEVNLPITLTDTSILTATDAWVTLAFHRSAESIGDNTVFVHGIQMYYY